jgi:hypothetical protein
MNPASNVTGSDSLLSLTLMPRGGYGATIIHARLAYRVCDDIRTKDITLPVTIAPNVDTSTTAITLRTSSVSFGNQAIVIVSLSGLPISSNVTMFKLFVTYDHSFLTLTRLPQSSGTLTQGWTTMLDTGFSTDTLIFTSIGTPLGISGTLTDLVFQTFVADTTASAISVVSSLPSYTAKSGCEVLYNSRVATTSFMGKSLCGDSVLRAFMATGELLIDRIDQSGVANFDVHLSVPYEQNVSWSVSDVLGHSLQTGSSTMPNGDQIVRLDLNNLPSGVYLLQVQGPAGRQMRQIVITH